MTDLASLNFDTHFQNIIELTKLCIFENKKIEMYFKKIRNVSINFNGRIY